VSPVSRRKAPPGKALEPDPAVEAPATEVELEAPVAGSPDALKLRVADGTQVHHAGRRYEAGETLTATPAAAREWIARGYVAVEED